VGPRAVLAANAFITVGLLGVAAALLAPGLQLGLIVGSGLLIAGGWLCSAPRPHRGDDASRAAAPASEHGSG
jgi:hypothetical protein